MAHSERCADFHVPFLRCESERAMCVVSGTGAARSASRTSENHQGKRCLNYISQQQLSSDLPLVAEHTHLLLVVSSHAFFLSVRAVETREFSGTPLGARRREKYGILR